MLRGLRTVGVALACLVCADTGHAETGYADSPPFALNTAAISGTDDSDGVPKVTQLGLCAPNPFNPSTVIRFDLAQAATTRLAIYDLRGRLVRTLVGPEVIAPGQHELVWDGRDDRGTAVSGGIYVYRLTADGFTAAHSMTLVK